MAYSAQDVTKLITQAKASGNEGLAYALYNGFTGMGGGMDPTFGGGAVDVELRNQMGNEAAKNWVGTTGNKYGNAMFDPNTGQYGYYENGAIKSGALEGYDPKNFSKAGYGNYTTTLPTTPAYATGVGLQGDNKTPMSEPAIDKNTLPPGLTGAPPSLANGGIKPTQPEGPTHPTIPSAPGYTDPGAPGGGNPPPGGGTTPGGPTDPGITPPGTTPGYTAPTPFVAPTRSDSSKTPFDFLNEEGLKFRLSEGMDQLENAAASRGGLHSGQTLKDLEKFRQGVSSEEYDKAYGRYDANRKFGEEQFQTDRTFGRNAYTDDRNFGRDVFTADRTFDRKAMESDRAFQEDKLRYGQDFAEQQYKDRRNYQTSQDKYNSEQEYQRWLDERNFNYKAGTDDRAFNSGTLTSLAQMGLDATKGDAAAQQAFLDQITRAIMTGGLAEAQGGMGQAQNITDLINSFFAKKN